MAEMPRPRLPHVQRETTRHGRTIWYFRRVRGGGRVRLPDDYGSPEFAAAYQAALAGQPAHADRAESGTLAWVVERYKDSGAWSALAPSTRKVRDRLFTRLCDAAGSMPVRAITKAHIQRGMDDRAATPEAANAFLKTMRQLLAYAARHEMVETNVAADVPMIRVRTDGHHTWTIDEIHRFEDRHPVGTKARLALDLLLYTGLRKSDVVRVGRQHIRDGVLTIRPEKTRRSSGVTVTLRILPALAESIAATKTGDLTLIVTEYGRPFTANGFGNWFRDRCDEAGVPGSAHGLRKAGAVRAVEAGATTHELMAMYGWTSTSEAERYTRAADRKRLGMQASERLVK